MKSIRMIATLALIAGVSACASTETASRNATLDKTSAQNIAASQPVASMVNVTELVVDVPQSLRVSEANLFYPGGDIVWREDPRGDRHAQVKTIVEAGLTRGLAGLPKGDRPVRLLVEVTRFHALTEKARYTTGGVHAIQFTIAFQDPQTGSYLTQPRLIKADFKGYGGTMAVAAEQRGETQKYRITQRIASVIQQELLQPGTTTTAGLGVIGALNQL